jgi:hypothetical protein
MKHLFFLICVTSLLTTTGCIVPEGDHRDRGREEVRHDDRGGPPEVVVRPPEVIVR